MFPVSTIQFKALLNVACKIVDNTCTFFWVIRGWNGEEPFAQQSSQVV